MNDYQHKTNIEQVNKLRALGYEINVNADGYSVKFKGEHVAAAGVILPRAKPLHWKHARQNIKDFLANAIQAANKHYESQKGVAA